MLHINFYYVLLTLVRHKHMSNLSHYWYYLHFTQFRLSLETYNIIQCTQLAKCTFIYTTPNILTWVRRYNRTLWTYITEVINRINTSLKLQLISKRLLFAQRYTLHLMFALWLICKLYVYDMKINTRIYIWKLVYTVPVLSVFCLLKNNLTDKILWNNSWHTNSIQLFSILLLDWNCIVLNHKSTETLINVA